MAKQELTDQERAERAMARRNDRELYADPAKRVVLRPGADQGLQRAASDINALLDWLED